LCQRELSHNYKLVVAINVFFSTPIVASELQWKSTKNFIDGWMKSNVNMMLQSQLQIGYILVALELHNSCFYTIAIELHELHTYMVPHTVN
jgi:hypothetical protein